MADVNDIDRLDLLIIKGMALLQDMLVGLAGHREGLPEEKYKRVPLAQLARRALIKPAEAPLLELILEAAKIRNQPAHELQTDEFVGDFVNLWERLRGDCSWPTDAMQQRDYCQTFFVLIAFELHRCGYDLPQSGQITGAEKIDWERHRRLHADARELRRRPV